MRTIRLIAVCLMFTGCGSEAAPVAPAEAPAPPEPVAVEEPEPEPEPPTLVLRSHTAQFAEGTLAACTDLTVTVPIPEPLPAEWPPTNLIPPRDGQTVIQRPCVEQFNRDALASCLVERDVEASEERPARHVALLQHLYAAETVMGSDREMQACLEMGGDWRAVERNGGIARRARLEGAMRDSRRAQEQLNQLQRRGR